MIKSALDSLSRLYLSEDFFRELFGAFKFGNIKKYGFDFLQMILNKKDVFAYFKLKHIKSGSKRLDESLVLSSFYFNYLVALIYDCNK